MSFISFPTASHQITLRLCDSDAIQGTAYISGSYISSMILADGQVGSTPSKLLNSVQIDGIDANTPDNRVKMTELYERVQTGINEHTGKASLEAGRLVIVTGRV